MYMEVDQIQCKFPKISNGGYASTIVTQREKKMDDDEEEAVENRRRSNPNNGTSADPGGGAVGLYTWPASRIVRVSRATGGKDRHSKVLTSKGLRDRRVRLSVNTAIEFYDLQDRLGYDQPSKAVEWLLAAAATSIAELPPMNPPFPLANRPPEEENMCAASGADQRMITLDSVTDRGGGSRNRGGAQKEAKSSSSSETSKGSGLSISRSENRFRAREKAKEGEKENSSYVSSFTELLNGGGLNYINGGGSGGMEDRVCRDQREINNENSEHQSNFFPKFPLEYFTSGHSMAPTTASPAPHLFSAAADQHPELQPFSFASDNLVSAINRGTLQSNFSSSAPPSLHYHPSFFGHRHLLPGFDGRSQVYNGGDGEGNDGRQSGPKKREKP